MKKLLCPILLLGILMSLCASPVAALPDDPIDRMTFFGESTTSHLALRGGIDPLRVWSSPSCTMKLDSGILSRTVTDHATGKPATPAEMARAYQPEILILSFGLNGILSFSERPEAFLRNYRKLIDAVHAASPKTQIILQAVSPVADEAHQTDWKFSVPPQEINRRLSLLNGEICTFCKSDPDLTFANTALALTDPAGFLRADLTTDGIHLTAAAYAIILSVLRDTVCE